MSCLPLRRFAATTALLVTAVALPARAAEAEQSGWLAWFNNTAFSDRLGLISDVQLRTRDDWAGPRNLLIRPGLSWYAAPGLTPSAGYAWIGTFNADAADATEHRLWQQLVHSRPLAGGSLALRARLEQRFIGRPGAPDVYSDRLRGFVRGQWPLAGTGPFTRGTFVALQNEAMLNLSGRGALNGRVFDQNRAYAALGFRWSPTTEVEVGYLNQWINGRSGDVVNHVLQVAFYTFFR